MTIHRRRALFSFAVLLASVLGAGISFSREFQKKWTPIADAKFYEYEIAIDQSFSSNSLLTQSRVDQSSLTADLQSGTYYLRYRAVRENGEAQAWSNPEKLVIGAQSTAFRNPIDGSKIQILTNETPVRIEWETVDGAEEYELTAENITRKIIKKFTSKVPSASVTGLQAGTWKITVAALRRGDLLSRSSVLTLEAEGSPTPRPRFLEPKTDDLLASYEISKIRWVRGITGTTSKVEIRDLLHPGRIVSVEDLDDEDSTYFPALPPGRYQITVQDFAADRKTSASESVTVTVQDDPLGRSSRYLGQNFRVSNLINFGWNGFQNDGNYPGWISDEDKVSMLLELRASGRVFHEWGYEGIFFGRFNNPTIRRVDTNNGRSYSESIDGNHADTGAYLGPSYRFLPFGPTKPLLLKALLGWSRLKYPVFEGTGPLGSSNANQYHAGNFRLISLRLGADLRWGGWSRSWDLMGATFLDFPVWSWGSGMKTGVPIPLPAFELRVFARRKLFYDFRFDFGMMMNLERLRISREGNSSDSVLRSRGTFGPILALETDF